MATIQASSVRRPKPFKRIKVTTPFKDSQLDARYDQQNIGKGNCLHQGRV